MPTLAFLSQSSPPTPEQSREVFAILGRLTSNVKLDRFGWSYVAYDRRERNRPTTFGRQKIARQRHTKGIRDSKGVRVTILPRVPGDYGFNGFFDVRDPQELFQKMQYDYTRMIAEPLNVYPAWDFFVTANHLIDWMWPSAGSAQHREERKWEAIPRICEHLANGAKHFILNREHSAVAHLERVEGAFDSSAFDASCFETDALIVTLDAKEVAEARRPADYRTGVGAARAALLGPPNGLRRSRYVAAADLGTPTTGASLMESSGADWSRQATRLAQVRRSWQELVRPSIETSWRLSADRAMTHEEHTASGRRELSVRHPAFKTPLGVPDRVVGNPARERKPARSPLHPAPSHAQTTGRLCL